MPGGRCARLGGTCAQGVHVCMPGDRACHAHSLHVDRMTDACENITLLQTSFAGANRYTIFIQYRCEILKFQRAKNRAGPVVYGIVFALSALLQDRISVLPSCSGFKVHISLNRRKFLSKPFDSH